MDSKACPQQEDESCLSAMFLTTNIVYSAVLNAAIDLNLFEIIANKASPPGNAMSAQEIASHLSSQLANKPDRLERMLRLLASYNLLTCSSRANHDDNSVRLAVYGLSPVGKYLVPNESTEGCSLASLHKFVSHKALLEVWMKLKEAIVDPDMDLFKKVHGKTCFEQMGIDAELNHIANKSMGDLCSLEMKRVVELYKGFEGISTLVDVGGGIGQNLKTIISKYPSIKGINLDLPHVIQNAPPIPGIQHVGGDMFASIPKGDAIILKAVCHNWSDEKVIEILKKCHEALPENGKVIIVEFILAESAEATEASKFVSTMDYMMMLMTGGGRERTLKHYHTLGKSSGFSSFHLASLAFSALGVMEFYKQIN
ncbi:isoliquiritigenin 2'-O-methyltransferase [Senna tora]|uniref:Isoliquiritigenin 2'-O-methyltransferase n=1 Tax=Senna tora TaxID=362788 RepID=A0A834TE33_9FABA|nr:isoliquiritigenin 2'-O-methyltransferase [Senna tora]